MKQLLLLTIICGISFLSKAQYTEERYNLEDEPTSIVNSKNELVFIIDNNETDSTLDDYIIETSTSQLGEVMYSIRYKINSVTLKGGVLTYDATMPNDKTLRIIFWQKSAGFDPMVVQQFSNGYVIFYGNIKY